MKKHLKAAAALVLAVTFALGGCAREGEDYVDITKDIVDDFPFEAEPVEKNPQQAEETNTYAVFHTSAGDITVMLYPEESPDEVERFIQQVEDGKFDGQQFVYVRRNGLIESDNVDKDSEQEEPGASSLSASGPASGSDAAEQASSEPAQAAPPEPDSTAGSLDQLDSQAAQSAASSQVKDEAEDAKSGSASASSSEAQEASSASASSSAFVSDGASVSESASTPDSISASSDSVLESGYTQAELDAVELPELPEDVEGEYYSDNLHHYYGSVGISAQNEAGADRLHFVVETTKPEDERLVPVTLYMRRLINQRLKQLNTITKDTPFSDLELAAFENRLNAEIQALSDGKIPDEYAKLYDPVNKMYEEVGGQWGLDYQYPIIGQIVEGQNVADAISQAKVDAQTRQPKQDIVIEHVEIIEK